MKIRQRVILQQNDEIICVSATYVFLRVGELVLYSVNDSLNDLKKKKGSKTYNIMKLFTNILSYQTPL